MAELLRIKVEPGSRIKATYNTKFNSNYPKGNGYNLRLDDGRDNGVGYELFFAYGGGLWVRNEGEYGWKKII